MQELALQTEHARHAILGIAVYRMADRAEVDAVLRTFDAKKMHEYLGSLGGYHPSVFDDETHAIYLMWWNRIIPYRSYVKGWKISPSFYVNQDLATIWLDR